MRDTRRIMGEHALLLAACFFCAAAGVSAPVGLKHQALMSGARVYHTNMPLVDGSHLLVQEGVNKKHYARPFRTGRLALRGGSGGEEGEGGEGKIGLNSSSYFSDRHLPQAPSPRGVLDAIAASLAMPLPTCLDGAAAAQELVQQRPSCLDIKWLYTSSRRVLELLLSEEASFEDRILLGDCLAHMLECLQNLRKSVHHDTFKQHGLDQRVSQNFEILWGDVWDLLVRVHVPGLSPGTRGRGTSSDEAHHEDLVVGEGAVERYGKTMVRLARQARLWFPQSAAGEMLDVGEGWLRERGPWSDSAATLVCLLFPPAGATDSNADRLLTFWKSHTAGGPCWDLCFCEAAESMLSHDEASCGGCLALSTCARERLLDALHCSWSAWLRLPGGIPLWEGGLREGLFEGEGMVGVSVERAEGRKIALPGMPWQCSLLLRAMAHDGGMMQAGTDGLAAVEGEGPLDVLICNDVAMCVGRFAGRVLGREWGRHLDGRLRLEKCVTGALMQASAWVTHPHEKGSWCGLVAAFMAEMCQGMALFGRGGGVGRELLFALRTCAEGLLQRCDAPVAVDASRAIEGLCLAEGGKTGVGLLRLVIGGLCDDLHEASAEGVCNALIALKQLSPLALCANAEGEDDEDILQGMLAAVAADVETEGGVGRHRKLEERARCKARDTMLQVSTPEQTVLALSVLSSICYKLPLMSPDEVRADSRLSDVDLSLPPAWSSAWVGGILRVVTSLYMHLQPPPPPPAKDAFPPAHREFLRSIFPQMSRGVLSEAVAVVNKALREAPHAPPSSRRHFKDLLTAAGAGGCCKEVGDELLLLLLGDQRAAARCLACSVEDDGVCWVGLLACLVEGARGQWSHDMASGIERVLDLTLWCKYEGARVAARSLLAAYLSGLVLSGAAEGETRARGCLSAKDWAALLCGRDGGWRGACQKALKDPDESHSEVAGAVKQGLKLMTGVGRARRVAERWLQCAFAALKGHGESAVSKGMDPWLLRNKRSKDDHDEAMRGGLLVLCSCMRGLGAVLLPAAWDLQGESITGNISQGVRASVEWGSEWRLVSQQTSDGLGADEWAGQVSGCNDLAKLHLVGACCNDLEGLLERRLLWPSVGADDAAWMQELVSRLSRELDTIAGSLSNWRCLDAWCHAAGELVCGAGGLSWAYRQYRLEASEDLTHLQTSSRPDQQGGCGGRATRAAGLGRMRIWDASARAISGRLGRSRVMISLTRKLIALQSHQSVEVRRTVMDWVHPLVELYPAVALPACAISLSRLLGTRIASDEDADMVEEVCWWAAGQGGGSMVGRMVGDKAIFTHIVLQLARVPEEKMLSGGMEASAGELWRRLVWLMRPLRRPLKQGPDLRDLDQIIVEDEEDAMRDDSKEGGQYHPGQLLLDILTERTHARCGQRVTIECLMLYLRSSGQDGKTLSQAAVGLLSSDDAEERGYAAWACLVLKDHGVSPALQEAVARDDCFLKDVAISIIQDLSLLETEDPGAAFQRAGSSWWGEAFRSMALDKVMFEPAMDLRVTSSSADTALFSWGRARLWAHFAGVLGAKRVADGLGGIATAFVSSEGGQRWGEKAGACGGAEVLAGVAVGAIGDDSMIQECLECIENAILNSVAGGLWSEWREVGSFVAREAGQSGASWLCDASSRLLRQLGLMSRGSTIGASNVLSLCRGLVEGGAEGYDKISKALENSGFVFSSIKVVREGALGLLFELLRRNAGYGVLERVSRGEGGGEDGASKRCRAAVGLLKEALREGRIGVLREHVDALVGRAITVRCSGGKEGEEAADVLCQLAGAATRDFDLIQRVSIAAYQAIVDEGSSWFVRTEAVSLIGAVARVAALGTWHGFSVKEEDSQAVENLEYSMKVLHNLRDSCLSTFIATVLSICESMLFDDSQQVRQAALLAHSSLLQTPSGALRLASLIQEARQQSSSELSALKLASCILSQPTQLAPWLPEVVGILSDHSHGRDFGIIGQVLNVFARRHREALARLAASLEDAEAKGVLSKEAAKLLVHVEKATEAAVSTAPSYVG